MAKYVVNDTDLTAVANAIRSKGNTSETLTWPTGFKNAIDNISFDVEDVCIKTTDFDDIIKVDDAAALDARDIVMKIEPAQDLHGYDNPWPAGGGKNLFDIDGYLTDRSASYTKNGDTYTITAASVLFTDQYEFSDTDEQVTISFGSLANVTTTNVRIDMLDTNGTIVKAIYPNTGTQTVTARKMRFNWSAQGYFTISKLQIERGSSATSYAPYSNICPIMGWTEATVTSTGKNLLEMFGKSGSNMLSKNTFVKTGTYTASASGISGNYATYVRKATTEGSFSGDIIASKVNQGNITFTLEEDTDLMIQWYTPNDSSADLTGKTFQLELSSTATDYAPYNGNTYDFTFPSEAGTVYGGTLDVTTGILTMDRAMITFDGSSDELWSHYSINSNANELFRIIIRDRASDIITSSASNISDYKCNQYKPALNTTFGRTMGTYSGSNTNVDFVNDNYFTVETWAAYLAENPIIFVYPLATPTTYQLTPQEITMLKGTNVIFSTTGKTQLKYFTEAFEPLAEELGL